MFADERQIIEDYFRANWSETLAIYDNDDTIGGYEDSWLRLTIIPSTNFNATDGYLTLSPVVIRYTGYIAIQLFNPVNVGSGVNRRLTDEITKILRNKSINGINLKATSIQRIGIREGWYQTNIITPYYWDEQLEA